MIVCDKKINHVGGSLVIYITKEARELGLKNGDIMHITVGESDDD